MKNYRLLSFVLGILVVVTMQAQSFTHPGGLLSNDDIARVKQHVQAKDAPWYSSWQELQNYSLAKSTYTASPHTEIAGSGGSAGDRQHASADAYAAFLNAVEWRVTGQTKYADCAAKILSDWGATVVTANGQLFQFPTTTMTLAAEMLRDETGAFYSGWDTTKRDVFLGKVRSVFYPAAKQFCSISCSMSSWYAPAAVTVIAAGVLLDDRTIYNEGLALYRNPTGTGSIYGAIHDSGQLVEMGRDNVHAMLTLGALAQMAQIAYNQGDDLYSEGTNRLLKGFDYWCRYNSGHDDTPYEPYTNCDGDHWFYISTHNNGYRLSPDGHTFEMVYHHFREVKNMNESEFPYLSILTKLARPEHESDFCGYGTLFFTHDAATSPLFTTVPSKPVNFSAKAGLNYVQLHWNHPIGEDAAGFNVYRSTDGTNFSLLYTWNNYTNNSYKDESVTSGQKYYYKVALINKAGESEYSDVASAVPEAGISTLPDGWICTSINTGLAGSALFTSAQQGTIAVSGVGKEIGGTTDSHTFAYTKVSGDAILTVRLTSVKEAFYKIGLIMRGTLDGTSQRVGLTLGETGYRYLRMCTRSTAKGGTDWVNGDMFTYAPVWLRISRKGNVFSTYQSRDGENWFEIGEATVVMPKNYYVGMAVTTGSTSGTLYQAVFDHVTLSGTNITSVPAPSNFKVAAVNSSRTQLSWTAAEGAQSYKLLRATSASGTYETIADELEGITYSDSCLAAKTTYRYALLSRNISGESVDTAKVEVTMSALQLPMSPAHFKATWNGNLQVRLSWNFTDEASTYILSRATEKNGPYTVLCTDSVLTYLDEVPEANTTYYYKILAKNALGTSAESGPISVTVYNPAKLSGTIIGTDGSFGNVASTTKTAAMDDNLSTFFDSNVSNGAWVGIDMGRNVRALVSQVKYAPRSGYASRMTGGMFQVAAKADFSDAMTIWTVSDAPVVGTLTTHDAPSGTNFRYLRYIAPTNGYGNVAEVQFFGHVFNLKNQVITFPALDDKYLDSEDFSPNASSTAALPINYTSSNVTVATVIDNKLHITGSGTCLIYANQEGNDEYGTALTVSQKLTVKDEMTAVNGTSNDGWKLSPNPFSAYLNVSLSENMLPALISILDINGRIIASSTAMQQITTFNTQTFPQGLYFVRIAERDESTVHKVIKIN